MKPVTTVDKAVTWLITYHPFYASILLRRELIPSDTVSTAGVNGYGQIWYNRAFMDSLGTRGCAFVLAHECMHYMLGHCIRRGARDAYWWNHWGDAVINEMLLASNAMHKRAVSHFVFPSIDGESVGVRHAGAELCSVEELYAQNPNPPSKPLCGTKGAMWGEDIIDTPMDEGRIAELEATLHTELAQAVESAKRMGLLPECIERFAQSLLHVRTPWYDKLRQFFARMSDNDYSYANLDRRFIATGMYLPWFAGEGMGSAALIVDVSGSISVGELGHFSSHLNTILLTCMPEKLYVLYVHSKVCKVEEYAAADYPVTLSSPESGGTDMTEGVKWVCTNAPDVEAIVVLTDGYTPFGNDCGIPTFWAMTTDKVAPWGETVKLEVTQ